MFAKISLTIITLSVVLCITGCRSVPYSERSQLLLTSSGYENELGENAYDEYKKQYPRSNNQEYNAALMRTGTAISKVAKQDDFNWEFNVFESDTANAFCLPGGKVAVFTGIFGYMDNEAELACVVSHEVAHAVARHSGERISWAQLQSVGAWTVNTALQNETIDAVYGVGTTLGVMLPFSRANETEADQIGLILMARAGYNPRAAISFWKKFGGDKQTFIEGWLSTHPGGKTRIADLEDIMPEAEAEYQKARVKYGYGKPFTKVK